MTNSLRFWEAVDRWVVAIPYLVCTFFLLWTGALFALQIYGWLKFAVWQQVPIGAMFLAASAQDTLREYGGPTSPFNVVPTGSLYSIGGILDHYANGYEGIRKMLYWLLSTSFSGWLLLIAGVAFVAGKENEYKSLHSQ